MGREDEYPGPYTKSCWGLFRKDQSSPDYGRVRSDQTVSRGSSTGSYEWTLSVKGRRCVHEKRTRNGGGPSEGRPTAYKSIVEYICETGLVDNIDTGGGLSRRDPGFGPDSVQSWVVTSRIVTSLSLCTWTTNLFPCTGSP